MAADFPRGLYGHSSLRTFTSPTSRGSCSRGFWRGSRRSPGSPSGTRRPTSFRTRTASRSRSRHHGAGQSKRTMRSPATAAQSPTRERLGIRLVGSTYSERWLVVDAKFRGVLQAHHFHLRSAGLKVELPAVGDQGAVGVRPSGRKRRDAGGRRDDPRPGRGGCRCLFISRSSARPSTHSMRASPNIGGAAGCSSPAMRRI